MTTSLASFPWLPGTLAEPDLAAALASTESQRQRIARTLHDEVVQVLTALKMDAAAIEDEVGDREGPGRKLREMSLLLEMALACARSAAFDLRPLILDDLGLVPALEALAAHFQRRTGIPCDLQVNEEGVPDPGTRLGLFRIVQEWLEQDVVHTGATAASVQLVLAPREVGLRLEHNGTDAAGGGPQPQVPAALRARVHLLGGAVVSCRGGAHRLPCLQVRVALGPGSA